MLKNNVKVGQTVTGIVRNIRQYGAFIEIGGGVVGLGTYRRFISSENKNASRTTKNWTKS
ncbi:MAG: S1 RNA-binding domain-containing protein [Clostridia bacterium]